MFRRCCRCCRCCNSVRKDESDIDMNQLNQMKQIGAVIIDIRSPQEYKEGHIDEAIVIPDYEIRRINKIISDKSQLIIVYCGNGIRSKKVQRYLKQMGYYNVYNLYKGTENYWDF